MEDLISIGDIVKSTSGHDKDRLFIVLSIDKLGYFAIIDGKYHKRDNPKKKNLKHLLKIAHSDEILDKVNSPLVTDTEIYKMIKKYNKE